MNVKAVLRCVAVFAAGALLLAGSVSAQFTSPVKVSNVIEGGVGGVSAARCGSTVVVGFADAESTRPNSYAGVATSTNGGLTFIDRGTLPVPPPDSGFPPYILGSNFNDPHGASNPSVACANSNVFHYASVSDANGTQCNNGNGGCTGVSVSTSTNGGTTWGLPVTASIQGADEFDFVSPSIAVDPTNPMRLYLAYIEYDNGSNFFRDCTLTSYALAIVRSSDGGKTWTPPLRVDHACPSPGSNNSGLTGALGSPSIAVSPGGKIYVVDEFIGQSGSPNEIHFLRSINLGSSFSVPLTVSKHATSNALPQVAVDRTSSTHIVYLTWSGSPTGTYTDVLVSDSLNYGLSFSFPRPISAAPAAGVGRFQTNPVVAVDNDGQVVDCYYSTANNHPTSSSVYSYNCATSINHAASWTAQRLVSSAPVGYDAVTSDFLLHDDGFFTAFELQASGQRHVVGEKSDNP